MICRGPLTLCYIRASLDRSKQANTGDIQLAAAKAYHARTAGLPPWADAYERAFEDVHTDSTSYFADRRAGRDLLKFAQKGDAVIFAHLDRLGRSVFEIVETIQLLRKRGLLVHILDAAGQQMDVESPFGQMLVSVLGFAAALEKQRIGERTKAAMAHLKSKGRVITNLPIGLQDVGGYAVVHPEERRQLDEALTLWIRGWKATDILSEFNRLGYLVRGKPWTYRTLQRAILKDRKDRQAAGAGTHTCPQPK